MAMVADGPETSAPTRIDLAVLRAAASVTKPVAGRIAPLRLMCGVGRRESAWGPLQPARTHFQARVLTATVASALLILNGQLKLDMVLSTTTEQDFADALRAAGAALVSCSSVDGDDAPIQAGCRHLQAEAAVVMQMLLDGIPAIGEGAEEAEVERTMRIRTAVADDLHLGVFNVFRRSALVSIPTGASEICKPEEVLLHLWPHITPSQRIDIAQLDLLACMTIYARRTVDVENAGGLQDRLRDGGAHWRSRPVS